MRGCPYCTSRQRGQYARRPPRNRRESSLQVRSSEVIHTPVFLATAERHRRKPSDLEDAQSLERHFNSVVPSTFEARVLCALLAACSALCSLVPCSVGAAGGVSLSSPLRLAGLHSATTTCALRSVSFFFFTRPSLPFFFFFFMRMTTLSLQGNKMASPVSRAVLSVARSRVSAAARPAAFALAQRFYAAEAAKPAAAAPAAAAPAAAAPAAGRPPPRTNCCVLK